MNAYNLRERSSSLMSFLQNGDSEETDDNVHRKENASQSSDEHQGDDGRHGACGGPPPSAMSDKPEAELEKELDSLKAELRKGALCKEIEYCRRKIYEQNRPFVSAPPRDRQEGGSSTERERPSTSGMNNLIDLNFQTLLQNVNNTKKSKPRLVHNYLWRDPTLIDEDEIVTFTTTGVKVNRKMGKDYYKISVEQWGYGNSRILEEMIEANEVDVRGIRDYLDYTKTINRLFSKYVRGSVMLYDREYREAQRSEGFRWGMPQTAIQNFQLVPKPPQNCDSEETDDNVHRKENASQSSDEHQGDDGRHGACGGPPPSAMSDNNPLVIGQAMLCLDT
ncbi:hypothetical protein KP79_PYT13343 [Mizuhopecten yessoensis]|uniref:Uncharacterized protein n=1 Tax=Mizuhopecten yessoensis TaxID=6573 RepID=A0A210QR50_MIZYE|nr:hypothetical protein KP79_PYT13343 [Mizuhopecten yessoensis]